MPARDEQNGANSTESQPTVGTSPARVRTFADQIVLLSAEGFGLGRIPFAPGTFGSLWGIVIGAALGALHVPWFGFLALWIVMWIPGMPLCTRAADLRGRKDPGSVVWDEMTAFPLVYAFVPINWKTLALGFVLFRIFDISKPWPVRRLEKLPDGAGIMADDQAAGAFAAAILWALQQWVISA